MTDCTLNKCSLMMATDCTTPPNPVSTNIFINAVPPYTITAFEKNPLGYTETYCYSCEIQPTG